MKRIFKAIRTSIAILSTIANNALTIFSLRESPIRVSFSYIMLIISLLVAAPTIAQEIHTADLIGDDNDIQQIDVLINGEKIRFDFDTGCTELSISQETFNKLRESKAISNSDMTKERGELSLGDNSKRRYKTFYIDTLTIGDVNLYNVKAHITLTDNKKSSSLLGHSILKRFKWYTIANNKLTFELKDSATISFYRIEEELDALYTKKKCL